MEHRPFTRKFVVDLQLTNLVSHSAGPEELAGEVDSSLLFNGISVQTKSAQKTATAIAFELFKGSIHASCVVSKELLGVKDGPVNQGIL